MEVLSHSHKQTSERRRSSKFIHRFNPKTPMEVQAVSCLAWVIRRDTGAKAAHTRQLISAVSGLTVTIHSLVKGNEDCIPAVMRSLHPSGPLAGWERPTAEQPGTGEGHLCSCSNSLSLS
ncbi:myb-related transcription factor%2C partner of profilin-like [Scomber scombrus]|uniref:Myb-related transcription factor, partner of profilin-like n=1 Tax=Scomber scombrus TaxID=13677 RepID=A0AAV1Q975_SCOSC